MYHKPVCVKCQVEMHCKESGVGCLDMASFGPYKIWDSDLYECPKCGFQILTGFAETPMHHNEDSFDKTVQAYREHRLVVESR